MTVNPETSTVQYPIEREYNASIAQRSPLKDKVAAPIGLLALIDYRLYGLTENEIAIVICHTGTGTGTRGAERYPPIMN